MRTVLPLVLILFGLGFLLESWAAPADGSQRSPQRRYRDPLMPLLLGGLIGPQEKTLTCSVRTTDAKIPPPGPKLEIISTKGRIVLSSDTDGFLRFPFNLELIRENPAIGKLGEGLVFTFRLTSSTTLGINKRIELSAGDKGFVGDGAIRVWYPPHLEQKAEATLGQLEEASDFIRSELGIEPAPWGINLVEMDLSKVNHTTLQDYPRWYTWSYSVSQIESRNSQRANVHEWVEHTLNECVGLVQCDNETSNRFVLDGLADYVGSRFSKHFPTDYLSRLHGLIDEGMTSVNLPEMFSWQAHRRYASPGQLKEALVEFPAGYPLSFAFWERTCAEYGRDLPRRFVEAVRKEESRSCESCLRILEQLTGSSLLESRLEAMDVNETIQLIQDTSRSQERRTKIEQQAPVDVNTPRR